MEWVTCENVYEESWRRILEFANIELAIEAIESIHGVATNKTQANYKKQALQLRAALLQAKEYFDAALSSSLYTKPNHLYYGTVALTTACMLLRGDGNKSLDLLRKDAKNRHHGLDFTFSLATKQASEKLNLLENSYIKILENGHFPNWYKTLKKIQPVNGVLISIHANGATNTSYLALGNYEIKAFDKLANTKTNILDLLKKLPDINNELTTYGIASNAARGSYKLIDNKISSEQHLEFTFHSSNSSQALIKIVDEFKCEGIKFIYDINIESGSGILYTKSDRAVPSIKFPDFRETLDHKAIYYAEELLVPELVDLFLISYALSMLSRYYPDIWVTFIESHCKGAKLTERLVSILISKIPQLALNQFTDKDFVISQHRPFWHT